MAGLVAVIVATAVVVVHERGSSPVDISPAHPEAIRLKDGSFRGVHLGERTRGVVRTLGRPLRGGEFPTPTDASPGEQLPGGPGDTISLDYRDLAIAMRGGKAVWIVTHRPTPSCGGA